MRVEEAPSCQLCTWATCTGRVPALKASSETPRSLGSLALITQWTSDKHIMTVCKDIGAPIGLKDVCFSEHKVNGKSKG